ncbi:MAG: hypothetical protein JW784_06870 [Candidatus Cloacimonetes bacterium]|nr:hypothetical protein [Candidatus Cloacimonadota bacterium]
MRKGIILALLVCLIILGSWNFLHIFIQHKRIEIKNNIQSIPFFLISRYIETLHLAAVKLDSLGYIANISWEPDSLVARKLYSTYNLQEAGNILDQYRLPHVMQIFLRGDKINMEEFVRFRDYFKNFSGIQIGYNEQQYTKLFNEELSLRKIYLPVNIIIIVLTVLILTVLQIHNETRSDYFWQIYKRAGGRKNTRNRNYWEKSLILVFAPLTLNIGIYFLMLSYEVVSWKIDPRLFILEGVTILFSVILTRIILEDKFS